MVTTPRTTKSPCFFKKALGSSPAANRGPRVAVYTITTPMKDTSRVAVTRIRSNGGTLRRVATCVRASVVIRRIRGQNTGRDLSLPGAAPCPGGHPAGIEQQRSGRSGRGLAVPPPDQVRRQPGYGVDGHGSHRAA